ncbi:MAG TPA: SAM-dependent chlorinase/fluorinase [Pyrinomonadaceae bacterium]|nr:SAM-dependent chlorinase/fluorinase [Pyrinomonadaceae bacterium]
MQPSLPVITLLTDFGTADYFTGAVKGAILSVNPVVVIADITHEIPPQDIAAGAFTLLAAYKTFPAGTIHMAVVDPGVGSTRRPIIVSANEQFFVGPDNGLFTYIYDREPSHRTVHVTDNRYFRPSPSSTFHGRDIFAPVAAALSNGVAPEDFGPEITDEVRLPSLQTPTRIIHIDHFGNCVTNITRDVLPAEKILVINGQTIREFREFYGESEEASLFAIWGSAGFLEISVNGGSAAKILRGKVGDKVLLTQRRKDAKKA